MNPNNIKDDLKKHLNQRVIVKVYGMRNKTNEYNGYLKKLYPNIFTISENNIEKSFTYADLITGDIKIKYL